MSSRNALLLTLLSLGIVLFAFSGVNLFAPKKPPIELLAVLKANPTSLQPFSLTDQNNRPFNLDQLRNKNTLLFFGYTSCPDICPTTLTTLNLVYKQLKKEALYSNLNIIFVSVDPQRDTTNKLLNYTRYFNKDFIGVTGEKKDIDNISRQFNAGYIFEEKTSDDEYLVSHASSIFLINPELDIIAAFSPPHHADIITSQLLMISKMQ